MEMLQGETMRPGAEKKGSGNEVKRYAVSVSIAHVSAERMNI